MSLAHVSVTEQAVKLMLEHMRIGVAWPQDCETVQALITELNGLELLYKLLLNERDRLREQLQELRSEGNIFVTAED